MLFNGTFIPCEYRLAYYGKCQKLGRPYCELHSNMNCVSCGNQATHECEETFQFVCGYPLCDNCIDNGWGKHIKKSIQNELSH